MTVSWSYGTGAIHTRTMIDRSGCIPVVQETLRHPMKYTCDIILTGSTESNPSDSVEYEYLVRTKDADECFRLVLADLQDHEPNRTRILNIWLDETDAPDDMFPDGEGIVHRRGPVEMTRVQPAGLRERIKKWLTDIQ